MDANCASAPPEEWRDVPTMPGYRVSSLGRVIGPRGRVLSLRTNFCGYQCFHARRGGKETFKFAHVAACEAFHGPKPDGCEVRHLNGVRHDNRISNLCWGTKLENAQDMRDHGNVAFGERNASARLSESQAIEVLLSPLNGPALAKRFKVTVQTIYLIRSRKTWKHLTPNPNP